MPQGGYFPHPALAQLAASGRRGELALPGARADGGRPSKGWVGEAAAAVGGAHARRMNAAQNLLHSKINEGFVPLLAPSALSHLFVCRGRHARR